MSAIASISQIGSVASPRAAIKKENTLTKKRREREARRHQMYVGLLREINRQGEVIFDRFGRERLRKWAGRVIDGQSGRKTSVNMHKQDVVSVTSRLLKQKHASIVRRKDGRMSVTMKMVGTEFLLADAKNDHPASGGLKMQEVSA